MQFRFSFVFVLLFALSSSLVEAGSTRAADFNFDWRFKLLDAPGLPSAIPMDDNGWRTLRLPHDWSVEFPFDAKLEGATGYLPGGVGVYQKHFKTPGDLTQHSTYIVFDGVYNNATFWLNGKKLGENPYGYSPVYFDLTDSLAATGEDNIITVYVDHSRYGDSRWYTGSGIYRNVTLVTVDKLHVPVWGTFVTTPEVTEQKAKIDMEIKIKNARSDRAAYQLHTQIFDNQGRVVAEASDKYKLKTGAEATHKQRFEVINPKLWDTQNPNLYKALTKVVVDGKSVDEYVTPFGIRSIEFIPKRGFFLNGKPTFMKGVSLHHDGGLVGAAVPKGVWKRRLMALKASGVNAVRTAHNPYSQEFLDLCDELGLLVQNEFFDEFDYPKDKRLNKHERHDDYITRGYDQHFQTWAKSDLTRTMLRDRNHPSVVQWSIGNEIEWTYVHYRYVTGFWNDPNDPEKMDEGGFWGGAPKFKPDEMRKRYEASEKGQYILAETAKKLSGWVKELDTTRPTTANMIIPQVSHVSGYTDAVDIAGYSYRNSIIPWGQTYFPDKQVTINENPGTWEDWQQVLENPGVFSIFMWTGIDYIGERHEKWPEKSGWGDILDLAGFELQGWNYFKSIWVDEPHVSIGTLPLKDTEFEQDPLSGMAVAKNKKSYRWRDSNMHWNYREGELVLVEVTSNYATVELLLNGESLGYRSMSESPGRIMRWVVPFKAGTLVARAGFKDDKTEATLETTTKATGFSLSTDSASLKANAYDVAHLVVQFHDDKGRPVKTENHPVSFEINGDARLLGVDNGAPDNIQNFQSSSLTTAKGRALAIIQANLQPSLVEVTARSPGFPPQKLVLTIE